MRRRRVWRTLASRASRGFLRIAAVLAREGLLPFDFLIPFDFAFALRAGTNLNLAARTHYTQPEPRPHGGCDRAIPGLRAFEATCYLARRQRGRIRRIPKLLAGWLVLVEERAAQRVVHLRGGESRRAHLRDEAAGNSINSERGHRVSEQRRYRRVPTWVKRRDRSETHTCLSINHKGGKKRFKEGN